MKTFHRGDCEFERFPADRTMHRGRQCENLRPFFALQPVNPAFPFILRGDQKIGWYQESVVIKFEAVCVHVYVHTLYINKKIWRYINQSSFY